MTRGGLEHAIALVVALLIVFVARPQKMDLQPLAGMFDRRNFTTFTPYFPGFAALETQEIFDPKNAEKKKIVLLGASSVDAIGCDYTWHHPEPNQAPNVHYSCSIAGQLNKILKEKHYDDWMAFNLARNGSKLTPELYVFARVLALKPEIIIYGDSFNYYMWENAGAADLSGAQYDYMDQVFSSTPEAAEIWHAYKENLQQHGWVAALGGTPVSGPILGPSPRTKTDFGDLFALALILLKKHFSLDGMLRPVAYSPNYRDWTKPAYAPHMFDNPDPGLRYFQGIRLIDAIQRQWGGKTFFFFVPQWTYDEDIDYQRGLDDVFGSYLKGLAILYHSYVPMKMAPVLETYDGYHHNVFGNRKIAAAIFRDLKEAEFLP